MAELLTMDFILFQALVLSLHMVGVTLANRW